jgi:hypothetical protein
LKRSGTDDSGNFTIFKLDFANSSSILSDTVAEVSVDDKNGLGFEKIRH